jgi:hypothetical protein
MDHHFEYVRSNIQASSTRRVNHDTSTDDRSTALFAFDLERCRSSLWRRPSALYSLLAIFRMQIVGGEQGLPINKGNTLIRRFQFSRAVNHVGR